MSKNINSKNTTKKLAVIAEQAGMLLMTAAAITGMIELPTHSNNKVILPGQPSFVMATDSGEMNNPIRREREEAAPHYISYSVTQRTPSRSSKH